MMIQEGGVKIWRPRQVSVLVRAKLGAFRRRALRRNQGLRRPLETGL